MSREPRPCDCGRDHETCACGYAREECECGTLSACVLTWDRALARGALDGAGHRPVRMGGCTYPGADL